MHCANDPWGDKILLQYSFQKYQDRFYSPKHKIREFYLRWYKTFGNKNDGLNTVCILCHCIVH